MVYHLCFIETFLDSLLYGFMRYLNAYFTLLVVVNALLILHQAPKLLIPFLLNPVMVLEVQNS
jgi:hypothetical protein